MTSRGIACSDSCVPSESLMIDPTLRQLVRAMDQPLPSTGTGVWESVFSEFGRDTIEARRSAPIPILAEIASGSAPIADDRVVVRVPSGVTPRGAQAAEATEIVGAVVDLGWLADLIDPMHPEPEGLRSIELARRRNETVPTLAEAPDSASISPALIDDILRRAGLGGVVPHSPTLTSAVRDPLTNSVGGRVGASLPSGFLASLGTSCTRRERLEVIIVDAGFGETRDAERVPVQSIEFPRAFQSVNRDLQHGDLMVDVVMTSLEALDVSEAVRVRCVDIEGPMHGGPLWLLKGIATALAGARVASDVLILTAIAFRSPKSGESLLDRAVNRLVGPRVSIVAAAGNNRVGDYQRYIRVSPRLRAEDPGPCIDINVPDDGRQHGLELFVSPPDPRWSLLVYDGDRVIAAVPLEPTAAGDRLRGHEITVRDGKGAIEVVCSGDGEDALSLHLSMPRGLCGHRLRLGLRAESSWFGEADEHDYPVVGIASHTLGTDFPVRLGEISSGSLCGSASPASATGVLAVGGLFAPKPSHPTVSAGFGRPDDLFERASRFIYAMASDVQGSRERRYSGSSPAAALIAALMAVAWTRNASVRIGDVEDSLLAGVLPVAGSGSYGMALPGFVSPSSVRRAEVVSIVADGVVLCVATDRPCLVVAYFADSAVALRTHRFKGMAVGIPDASRRTHRVEVPVSVRGERFALRTIVPGSKTATWMDGDGQGLVVAPTPAGDSDGTVRTRLHDRLLDSHAGNVVPSGDHDGHMLAGAAVSRGPTYEEGSMEDEEQGTGGVATAGAQLDGGVWEIHLMPGGKVFYAWIDKIGANTYKEIYRTNPTDSLSFPLSHSSLTDVKWTRKSTSVSTLAQFNSWMNSNAPNHTTVHSVTLTYS